MGARRAFRPLLLATVSLLTLGQSAPALGAVITPPPGSPCAVSTFAGGTVDSAAIVGGRLLTWGLASLQATMAGISDQGLRDSLAAKVAAAQDSFTRGQDKTAANAVDALRHEISAQDGEALSSATATQLRSVSAEALVLLGA